MELKKRNQIETYMSLLLIVSRCRALWLSSVLLYWALILTFQVLSFGRQFPCWMNRGDFLSVCRMHLTSASALLGSWEYTWSFLLLVCSNVLTPLYSYNQFWFTWAAPAAVRIKLIHLRSHQRREQTNPYLEWIHQFCNIIGCQSFWLQVNSPTSRSFRLHDQVVSTRSESICLH